MQEKMLQVRAGGLKMRFLKLLTFYWLAKLGLHISLKFSQCLKVWFSSNSHLNHCKKNLKFSIKDFFSKCDQIRIFADLVTFTEEILNRKHLFCAVNFMMLNHPKNIK